MSPDLELTTFRADRPGIRKVLGDLEAEVMAGVWAKPAGEGTTVREVFEALHERRRLDYNSVINTMVSLAKKNILQVVKEGHACVYFPTLTEEEFVSSFVQLLLIDLLATFSNATAAGIEALNNPVATQQAPSVAVRIAKRRSNDEDA